MYYYNSFCDFGTLVSFVEFYSDDKISLAKTLAVSKLNPILNLAYIDHASVFLSVLRPKFALATIYTKVVL